MSRILPPTGFADPGDESRPPITPAGWSFTWLTPPPDPPPALRAVLSLADLDRLVLLRRAVATGARDEWAGQRRRWAFARWCVDRGLYSERD